MGTGRSKHHVIETSRPALPDLLRIRCDCGFPRRNRRSQCHSRPVAAGERRCRFIASDHQKGRRTDSAHAGVRAGRHARGDCERGFSRVARCDGRLPAPVMTRKLSVDYPGASRSSGTVRIATVRRLKSECQNPKRPTTHQRQKTKRHKIRTEGATMKPAKSKTESRLSTRLRKAVFGGSLTMVTTKLVIAEGQDFVPEFAGRRG